MSRFHYNQLYQVENELNNQVKENNVQEMHHLNGRKQEMMKRNNILVRNNEKEPIYKFMLFDYYKPEERIKLVRQNREKLVKDRERHMLSEV